MKNKLVTWTFLAFALVLSPLSNANPNSFKSNNSYYLHEVSNKQHQLVASLSPLIDIQNIDLHSNIIEIGCKTGEFSNYLMAKGAKKIIAVDLDQNYIDFARKNYQPNTKNNISYLKDDFFTSNEISKNLKEKNANFIFAINVLNTWSADKIEHAITKIYKGLQSGGSVLFTIKNPVANENLSENFFKNEYINQAKLSNSYLNDKQTLDAGVNKLFKKIKLYNSELELLPSSYLYSLNKRLILYPFEMKNTTNGKIYHLIFPANMEHLLKKAGFSDVKVGKIPNVENMFYIQAYKA